MYIHGIYLNFELVRLTFPVVSASTKVTGEGGGLTRSMIRCRGKRERSRKE